MDQPSLRLQVFDVIEGGSRHPVLSRIFSTALIALILINVGAAIFETVPQMSRTYFVFFGWIEAVSIVTPNHMHAPPAIAAMEAGFDVIIDKPLADSFENAKAPAFRPGPCAGPQSLRRPLGRDQISE